MFEEFNPQKVLPLDNLFSVRNFYSKVNDGETRALIARVLINDLWYVGGKIEQTRKRHRSIRHILFIGNAEISDITERMIEVLQDDLKWLIQKYGYETK